MPYKDDKVGRQSPCDTGSCQSLPLHSLWCRIRPKERKSRRLDNRNLYIILYSSSFGRIDQNPVQISFIALSLFEQMVSLHVLLLPKVIRKVQFLDRLCSQLMHNFCFTTKSVYFQLDSVDVITSMNRLLCVRTSIFMRFCQHRIYLSHQCLTIPYRRIWHNSRVPFINIYESFYIHTWMRFTYA